MRDHLLYLRDIIFHAFGCFGFHHWMAWTNSPRGTQDFCTRCEATRPGVRNGETR